MLKNGMNVINSKGLHYIAGSGDKPLKFKPWLGDAVCFLYDFIMRKSIFPKKFGADINRHDEILRTALKGIHGKRVLELAAGSGSASDFLPHDNQYTGTDISPGLLRKAAKRFRNAGFQNAVFFVTQANDLPFENNYFSIILCILSLNFFGDIDEVFKEVKRVAAPDAVLIVSVPVPERNKARSKIRGTLYSEDGLRKICMAHGLGYETIPADNGALLYFKAGLKKAE